VTKAWELLRENVTLYPPNQREYRQQRGQLFVAMAIARAGLIDSAKAVALGSRADTTIDPVMELVYLEMLPRNLMGDREEVLNLLRTYLQANPQERASIAKDDTWWLRGLRDDPRFRAIVGVAH